MKLEVAINMKIKRLMVETLILIINLCLTRLNQVPKLSYLL